MVLVYPDGTPTLGNIKVKAVLAIVDLTAPKLATELNAVGSVELSAHFYPAGWNPSGSTARGTKPARLAQKVVIEQFNRTTWSLADLQYVYDPQAADNGAGNEVKQLLVEGLKLYIVERRGLDAENTNFAVSQKVRTHYVQLGPQIPMGDPTDENADFFMQQPVRYLTGVKPIDGVLAA